MVDHSACGGSYCLRVFQFAHWSTLWEFFYFFVFTNGFRIPLIAFSYAIEDPFQGSLRLSILCDTIRRDVLGDELIRKTAFELPHELPPPVVEDSIVAATENKGEWFEKDCHDEIDDGTSGTTTTPKEQVIQSLQGSPTVNMEPDESDAYQ